MPKVLKFAVRTSVSSRQYHRVRESVERAMNLTFSPGEYEDAEADVAKWLGMTVALFRWGDDYLLESTPEHRGLLHPAARKSHEQLTISEALAHHLTVLGPFHWRTPTEADLTADRAHADALDRRSAEDTAPPPWAGHI